MSEKLKAGYKQTEVGVIPEDWEIKGLQELFTIKGGFAFSSSFFSQKGPVLLTPGNFKLEGGLYFNKRNTKHYSGPYSSSMLFERGDLLLVMTDLTPDCNLLGKPAFVASNEPILHNQRIGKIVLSSNRVLPIFLYWFFLSDIHARRMRETATGSTVRHTSSRSIYNGVLHLPPKEEQHAIAAALSDVDALIKSQDALIAKKRDIKQAAMQQLLIGKQHLPGFSGEWEIKQLGELVEIISGGTPRTGVSSYWDGNIRWCTPTDITGTNGKYLSETQRTISEDGLKSCSAQLLPEGTLLLCSRATIGEVKIATREVCTNQGFKSLICSSTINNEFLYYLLLTMKAKIIEKAIGSTFLEISKKDTASLNIPVPAIEEQTAIAKVLSDMDAEITALESERDKTKLLKQGMMQELLTGRTRLL